MPVLPCDIKSKRGLSTAGGGGQNPLHARRRRAPARAVRPAAVRAKVAAARARNSRRVPIMGKISTDVDGFGAGENGKPADDGVGGEGGNQRPRTAVRGLHAGHDAAQRSCREVRRGGIAPRLGAGMSCCSSPAHAKAVSMAPGRWLDIRHTIAGRDTEERPSPQPSPIRSGRARGGRPGPRLQPGTDAYARKNRRDLSSNRGSWPGAHSMISA